MASMAFSSASPLARRKPPPIFRTARNNVWRVSYCFRRRRDAVSGNRRQQAAIRGKGDRGTERIRLEDKIGIFFPPFYGPYVLESGPLHF
jgi:hypothetical protein